MLYESKCFRLSQQFKVKKESPDGTLRELWGGYGLYYTDLFEVFTIETFDFYWHPFCFYLFYL